MVKRGRLPIPCTASREGSAPHACPRTSLLLTRQRYSTNEEPKLGEVKCPRSHNKEVAVTPATQSPASRFNARPSSSQRARPRIPSTHTGHEVRVSERGVVTSVALLGWGSIPKEMLLFCARTNQESGCLGSGPSIRTPGAPSAWTTESERRQRTSQTTGCGVRKTRTAVKQPNRRLVDIRTGSL